MYAKKIKYTDFNDSEREETFYFHLSQADLVRLEAETEGGFDAYASRLVEARSPKDLVNLLDDLIARSYGVKSLDGRQFVKNQKVLEEFKQTNAYSDLFVQLLSDDKAAEEFIIGIMPTNIDRGELKRLANEKRNEILGTEESNIVEMPVATDTAN